jgi:amino acid transporter
VSERLSRSLTFIGFLGFGFNIMISSGIFFLPGEAMATMGPASVLGVLAALLVAALLVFCFAELSSQFSETGGPILYTHATLGPVAAFGVGWLGFLARVSSNAALVVIFTTSAVSTLPALDGSQPALSGWFRQSRSWGEAVLGILALAGGDQRQRKTGPGTKQRGPPKRSRRCWDLHIDSLS